MNAPPGDSGETRWLVGVDAGGSETVAWLSRQQPDGALPDEPLGVGRGGCGNPRSAGTAAATVAIGRAIEAAFQDAAQATTTVELAARSFRGRLCLAAAGAGRPREREELRRWASARFPNSQIAVTDDAQPILAAASERRVGVALICGTGSFAWGRDAAGRTQRCGGWGHLFGDEGSGYALGVAALRAVAQAADGRGPATSLVQAISARLDLREPSELIGCVYGRPLTRDRIARLSQVVFDQAPRDGVAQSLIEQAAASLAQLVNTLSRKLAFPRTDHRFSATLALAGGVLVHQPRFREALLEHVVPGFTSVRVVPHPVRGALLLAAAM